MKKDKQSGFGITIPLIPFQSDLYIACNLSFDDINKYINQTIPSFDANKDLGDIKDKYNGRVIQFGGGQILMYLPFIPDVNKPTDLSLMIHELFHAVHFVLESVDTPLCDNTCEVYAYMLQHLTSELLTAISEFNSKNK